MLPNDVEQVDAVVIGSGFGGAVAACRLSQAGFRVLLLERGRRYEANDFPALPDDDRLLPELKRWVWSQDQGLWDIEDLGEIIAVQAAGYGGGSLIYANVHLRPPEGTFDNPIWPAKFRNGALESYYDLAAHMLNVAPIKTHPKAPFPKTQQLDNVAGNLGRKVLHPPLAIAYEDRAETDTGEAQKACTGCGKCCTGCPEGAKSSLDLNYLAVAERNGARVRTQCEVTGIHTMPVDKYGNRWQVTYTNHLAAAQVTVLAKNVFVCAGAVGSTRLLKKAVLPPRPPQEIVPLQERIGLGYFPNADAAGMVYDTAVECSPSSGPTITTSTVHWQDERFFLIQDGGYAPELERLLGILRAPLWAGRNRTHMADAHIRQKQDVQRPTTPFAGVALVSPLDGMLDAFAKGAFAKAAPPKIAAGMPGFLREIEKPLLLPAVVEATVDRAWRARYAKSWLGKLFEPDTGVGKVLYGLGRDVALWLAGGPEDLGDHALRSVLNGGDLDRKNYTRELLNYDGSGANRRMLLLAMGQDAAKGALVIDEQSQKLVADLDLYRLMDGYTNQELLMKDIARQLGGELRLNPLWSFYGKPITVHSQGGCSMSELPDTGVTDANGMVQGCPGLYVLDGSILCQSVGVNPSPTILAVSERHVIDFIRHEKKDPTWPAHDQSAGAREYQAHLAGARKWRAKADAAGWDLRPEPTKPVPLDSQPLGLKFKELFHGYLANTTTDPGDKDADYRLLEIQGRPGNPFKLDLEVSCRDLNKFFEDKEHRLELAGKLEYSLPGRGNQQVDVTGFLELLVPRHKRWGLSDPNVIAAQERIAGRNTYTTTKGLPMPGEERFMYYHLSLPGDALRLEGYKRVKQDPGVDAWRDTTALFTRFGTPNAPGGKNMPLGAVNSLDVLAAGVIHVDLTSFLFREVPSFDAGEWQKNNPHAFEVTGTVDPARINWAVGKFVSYFFGTLQRVYSPGTADLLDAIYLSSPNGVRHAPPRVRA